MSQKYTKHILLSFSVVVIVIFSAVAPAKALDVVYDPWNYKQNLLTATRELEEIHNQVRQLTNQATMLTNMDKNLLPLGSSVAGELNSQLTEIRNLLKKAGGLALRVQETEESYKRLFPTDYADALTNDKAMRHAQERWRLTLASFQRSLGLQAQITENIERDTSELQSLMNKSQTAQGSLQAHQAGNELMGLNIKQSLQLQSLMAAQYRSHTLDRARTLSEQEEARLRFQNFMGDSQAYTSK